MPETDPRPVKPVLVSVIVTVPENDVPVWVTCHAIAPGPDESDAGPLHAPVRLTEPDESGGGVDEVGVEPLDPPPQAPNDTSAHNASA